MSANSHSNEGLRITILRDRPFDLAARFLHKYGGKSLIVDPLPDCVACKQPLKLAFEFDLRDPLLAFLNLKGARLPIITCCGCDVSYAGVLYYRVQEDGVAVLSSDATQAFEDWGTSFPESSVSIAPVPESERPSHFASLDAWDDAVRFNGIPKHQLGGQLLGVQDEMTIECCECGVNMRMLGQVDSETWDKPGSEWNYGHMFGDMGMIYLGICDRCNIFGTAGACY